MDYGHLYQLNILREIMRIQETSIVFQIWVNAFKSKDGNGNLRVAFIHNFNIPYCISNLATNLATVQPTNFNL
jgi:hypothetical protein